MLISPILCLLVAAAPSTPVSFGQSEIAKAVGPRASHVRVTVTHKGPPESYTIRCRNGEVTVAGADANGAMYGALEFAERAKMRGAAAWRENAAGRPYLRDRGMNTFLTLPWEYKKNNTDYDPAALTDPKRWYFQNDDYWRTLFDLMARSRLNWLDIHGTWDVSVTDAPNLYAYFVQSAKYPEVGVAPEIKAANLRQLNRVIAMAHARGIRVSLMAYQATLGIPQNPRPPYRATEAILYDCTREVVEKTIRGAPGLDAIGFRIGESGRAESFYNCYLEAVKRSGRKIPLITRSWLTRKQNVLPLARGAGDFSVEIKYNGEQWGADYMVAGGRMANWASYSYEDYLSDSGSAPAAKMWSGNPASGGGRWPDEPYKIVWQVRANGTHRIFPFYEPDRVRNSILQMKIGSASGYTVEGFNAYYPASPDYYVANPADRYCDWVHQRDEMYWMLWGRLGYDPATPESVFRHRIDEWFGSQGRRMAVAWKAASNVIPLVYTAFSLGPDHRNHAPELEWGGTTDDYIVAEPFDTLSVIGLREQMADRATGGTDGRPGLAAIAGRLGVYSASIRAGLARFDAASVPRQSRLRFNELTSALKMLDHLADYYRGRFRSASDLVNVENRTGIAGVTPSLLKDYSAALGAWLGLSTSPEAGFYRPFTERLRMHTNTFHWRSELPKVEAELRALVRLPASSAPTSPPAPLLERKERGARPPTLTWRAVGRQIECSFPAAGIERAWVLEKPLPSAAFWHRVPMPREGARFVAHIDRGNWGHCLAADVQAHGVLTRIPSILDGRVPYIVVPATTGPTPPLYGVEEAMNYLDPKSLTPQKHGLILVGTRAWAFHRSFPLSVRRKLLDPVRRGMTLLVLQQDYASGRYPLDWLPAGLRAVDKTTGEFDPGGSLGLPVVRTRDIQWQAFTATDPSWQVFGSGAVAHCKLGKGDIWMVQARLQPRLQIPECAVALVKLLKLGGTKKPVVLVDSGTEGADKCSSVLPDLMNSHGVPFLTLGEVIAREQGMTSAKQVPGEVQDDSVLEGRGRDIMTRYLAAKVHAKASVPTAATREAFEALRPQRRAELMRTLGLDHMPARTPLNARITATYQRKGYRVESIVLESRPRFYVTAQAYVPDGLSGARYPVIVNPIGHWAHKKAEPVVQARCIFQALRGYLSVVVDSPGWSFEGDNKIERRGEGTHDDYKTIAGGTNTTGYYVWDLMRVLDYVATRPDADMAKVGLTGASGGGLATLYAFAADDRYTCAVPVVYVSSMELAPDNGCLCNHVPGMLQVGDRSDVLAIQAPKPILIIGAQADGEFPPDAMRLTGEKVKRAWKLFGADGDVKTLIFPGGHDYGKGMREAAMGFFDKYLKGVGDGSPVPEPEFETLPPTSPELFVLSEPPVDERTMRDLAQESLTDVRSATFADMVRVNGGLPRRVPLNYHEIGTGSKRFVTFDSEAGLTIPAVLYMPKGKPKGVKVMLADAGKVAAAAALKAGADATDGYACLCIDARAVGELSGVNERYLAYLGEALAFGQAWDLARAVEAMRRYSSHVEIVTTGPIAGLAAVYAGLMDPKPEHVTAYDCLKSYADVFRSGVPDLAVQPRANLCGSLDALRALVRNGEWHFRAE